MGFLPKDYVSVSSRIEKYHSDHDKDISIETNFELKGEVAIFKAIIRTKKGTFTGSSFGKLGKEKAFEKLETVAVGRALAFAGYEVTGGIASREEMENFEENEKEVESNGKVKSGKHNGDNWFNEKDIEIIKILLSDGTVNINYLPQYLMETYSISKDMATRLDTFIDTYKKNLG